MYSNSDNLLNNLNKWQSEFYYEILNTMKVNADLTTTMRKQKMFMRNVAYFRFLVQLS